MRNIGMRLEEKVRVFKANPYFGSLGSQDLKTLAERSFLQEFERSEILLWEGEPCTGMYIILTGSVKLYRASPQGRQYIIRVLQEGDTFNEVPAFDGGANAVNVDALETCQVLLVPAEVVCDLLSSAPGFAEKVIQSLAQNLRNLVRMVSEMAFYQVTHRLARLISELPEDELSGDSGARMTQDQLAARLGTVREVVARSLRELERSGAIQVESRRIQITDADVLQQWTQPWN